MKKGKKLSLLSLFLFSFLIHELELRATGPQSRNSCRLGRKREREEDKKAAFKKRARKENVREERSKSYPVVDE